MSDVLRLEGVGKTYAKDGPAPVTVLDRLAKKGLVGRQRDGRAWLYVAGPSRAELVSDSLTDVLDQAGEHRAESLRQFVSRLPDADLTAVRDALR